MKLVNFLSFAAGLSRRKSFSEIKKGRVRVNGEVVTVPSREIAEEDEILYRGRKLSFPKTRVLILNKPPGFETTAAKKSKYPSVYQLLPSEARNFKYAGRLDVKSEGLLLFSNDPRLVSGLTAEGKVEKVYLVWTKGALTPQQMKIFTRGVILDDGLLTKRCRLFYLGREKNGWYKWKIVLREGKKNQLRRMFGKFGVKVKKLKRIRVGPVKLGWLRKGEWRWLKDSEVEKLSLSAGLSEDSAQE